MKPFTIFSLTPVPVVFLQLLSLTVRRVCLVSSLFIVSFKELGFSGQVAAKWDVTRP